jgi:hypothetical protein
MLPCDAIAQVPEIGNALRPFKDVSEGTLVVLTRGLDEFFGHPRIRQLSEGQSWSVLTHNQNWGFGELMQVDR